MGVHHWTGSEMTYSLDLRKRVAGFVEAGGRKAEAARRYEVSLWCVNDWCKREDLRPKAQGRRHRKLDWAALRQHIQEHPDALLRERAVQFGVHIHAIWYACHQMRISHKKNAAVQGAGSRSAQGVPADPAPPDPTAGLCRYHLPGRVRLSRDHPAGVWLGSQRPESPRGAERQHPAPDQPNCRQARRGTPGAVFVCRQYQCSVVQPMAERASLQDLAPPVHPHSR